MSRRATNRRGLKKRGIFPSFGDMVLPIVGISALVLLVLAGRHFFLSGIKTSPEITSTQAYANSPAIMAERSKTQPPAENTQPPSTETANNKTDDTGANDNMILAVSENNVNPPLSEVKPAVSQPVTRTTETPKKATTAPAKMTNLPPEKQWRVQVGAYPSKAEAEKVAKRIRREGFKARIYQNPASKHVKVWVEAGENKYQAGLMVDAMKKLGFKSSFSFPPMKQ